MLKTIAKRMLANFGPHMWPQSKGQLLILAYHRVLPITDARYKLEQPPMVVTPQTLSNNILWLKQHMQVVRLVDWLGGQVPNQSNARCCAITFDDGWIDNLTYGLPILEKHNVPATIYCVASMLENGLNYWPGRLAGLVRTMKMHSEKEFIDETYFNWLRQANGGNRIDWNALSEHDIDELIEKCKIYTDDEINFNLSNSIKNLNLDCGMTRQVMNVSEVRGLISSGFIDIGCHTFHHTRLTETTADSILDKEIVQSKFKLEELLGCQIRTFCYPNGYAPKNAADRVRNTYEGATTLCSGWNSSKTDKALLRRIGMHEAVAHDYVEFSARLSGFL